jgi:hypothetical protein
MSALPRAVPIVEPLACAIAAVLASRQPAVVAALPVVGVFRGPLGWWLLALGAGIALARVLPPGRGGASPPPRALFAISLLVCASWGTRYAGSLRVSGDEPHYLLMAQSLWREHDLDLRDNLAREDYREYTPGVITPHYAAPRRDGRPFPAHSPGLPFVLAPLYALGGRAACVLFLALAAALTATLAHLLALRATGDARAALLAWALASGPPLFFYAFHVYSEAPSALALAGGLAALLSPPGVGMALLGAVAAAALPWLHVKMVPAAAALGVIALVRLRGRPLAAFLLTAGAAAAVFFAYYEHIFGVATPLAIYGGTPRDLDGAPLRALAGLLLDRSFGLLTCAPAFVVALAGVAALGRRSVADRWAHALVAIGVVAPVLGWRMWWGGQCPPARFLVPLVPTLAVLAACRLAASRAGLARWAWPLVALGWSLAFYMTADPGRLLLLNRGDRPTRVWESLSVDTAIARYLPSLAPGDTGDVRVTLLWCLALAAVLAVDRAAMRHERADRAFRGLALPLLLLLALGAGVDGWARTDLSGQAATVEASRR